jgi:DNA-binding XRE family transcriptional regulator
MANEEDPEGLRCRNRPHQPTARGPEAAKRVAENRADGREMEVHPLNLGMTRKAAEMTQKEVAERLGDRRGDVSRIESRDDLLLSTLVNYLTATGAEDACIVVTVNGREIALDRAILARKVSPTADR